MAECKNLTIFEGPDGSGKSTAAMSYALRTGAKYVHFDARMNTTKSLGRTYVEAMLPALLGYQDVVFDRCWLSERPYRIAFHGEDLRLDTVQIRMLERLAMRCGAVLVKCYPSWDVVSTCYRSRPGDEMLDNEDQLKQVYQLYGLQSQGLPCVTYDYTTHCPDNLRDKIEYLRFDNHDISLWTAGNRNGELFIKARDMHDTTTCDHDSFYTWPEGFLYDETSYLVTQNLINLGIEERQIFWCCDANATDTSSKEQIQVYGDIK